MAEIRKVVEDEWWDLKQMVQRLHHVAENAYKLSNKDTPYEDSDSQVRALQLIMKIMWLGKPQQVINVLNMRGKSPMN